MTKPKETTDNNMILVEAGRFEMGEKQNVKYITISKDFYICKYQVTFEEYDNFCEEEGRDKPGDNRWGRGNRPVIYVSWYDAIEYCNWKSRKENGLEEVYTINKSVKNISNKNLDNKDKLKWNVTCDFDKNGYRLPTDAEWEFAAKGGNESIENYKYSGSNDINEVAWYYGNSGDTTHFVGEKRPNELGIYDMTGNVKEWCWDWYTGSNSGLYDPKGSKEGSYRVVRGGCWNFIADDCELTFSLINPPSRSIYDLGFRVSRTC